MAVGSGASLLTMDPTDYSIHHCAWGTPAHAYLPTTLLPHYYHRPCSGRGGGVELRAADAESREEPPLLSDFDREQVESTERAQRSAQAAGRRLQP